MFHCLVVLIKKNLLRAVYFFMMKKTINLLIGLKID